MLEQAANALTVPYEAVADRPEGGKAVYVLNADQTVTVVPVQVGIENALKIQVISDRLSGGEQVILNPDPTLTDGSAVAGGSR